MKIFNPPSTWMDNVSPALLERFWKSKGHRGMFIQHTDYGIDIRHIPTLFGVLMTSGADPMLSSDETLEGLMP